MTCAMGGRKDDVKRTQKAHKKRPLSAVIEELEGDDSVPKTNHNGSTNFSKEPLNELAQDVAKSSKSPDNAEEGGSASASTGAGASSTSSPPSHLTSPGTINDGEGGKPDTGTLTASCNSPRRSSLRGGRRQALTPSFSPKLGRATGGSALTSPSRVPNERADSDDDTLPPSDMTRVRQTADRLHLSTRRPSVMQWRAQYVECPKFPLLARSSKGSGDVTGDNGDGDGAGEDGDGDGEGRWTAERTQKINTALDWIINELQEMRTQDQLLARQLLTIRSDLHQLKLARSCEEHQDMLDDVQSDLEDLQEFADVLDLPVPTITDSPLKHLGVTRMNFSARRFSTC